MGYRRLQWLFWLYMFLMKNMQNWKNLRNIGPKFRLDMQENTLLLIEIRTQNHISLKLTIYYHYRVTTLHFDHSY